MHGAVEFTPSMHYAPDSLSAELILRLGNQMDLLKKKKKRKKKAK